ncbi:hypothetical protein [Photobacterium profundum]|uniref:hypothetical protein n=1 Tax=Photobacterium profundum TaxID=74109 RepID=UPI003D0F74E2
MQFKQKVSTLGLLLPFMLISSSAIASSQFSFNGKWQCEPTEVTDSNEESWVVYDFRDDGTVMSEEWGRYQSERKTQLEFKLFIDYRFELKGDDYVLKPLELTREIISDPHNLDPFNYDQRRDLTGYRIFFKPTLKGDEKAQFDMWYHITPEDHFSMQCEKQKRA